MFRERLRNPKLVLQNLFSSESLNGIKVEGLVRPIWHILLRKEIHTRRKTLEQTKQRIAADIGQMMSLQLQLDHEQLGAGVRSFVNNLSDITNGDANQDGTLKEKLFSIHQTTSDTRMQHYRWCFRPSVYVRYWPAAVLALMSGSTILNKLSARKNDLAKWISETRITIVDFWYNWVVQPCSNVISTIRHSEDDAQLTLMSKRSLLADTESLTRMVVDFSKDRKQYAGEFLDANSKLDLDLLTRRVREGDLSPVLRAYEHDLRSPLRGSVTGDLIRSLLIQIQKTKVDVEVALSGIDKIIKSQELVFGFVGLTPGLAVCYLTWRYLGDKLLQRNRLDHNQRASGIRRNLRNIYHILNHATGRLLNYEEIGLLLCETNMLRKQATKVSFPRKSLHEDFLEDIRELEKVSQPVSQQQRLLDLILRLYDRYL